MRGVADNRSPFDENEWVSHALVMDWLSDMKVWQALPLGEPSRPSPGPSPPERCGQHGF
jgi:hypothetical protein